MKIISILIELVILIVMAFFSSYQGFVNEDWSYVFYLFLMALVVYEIKEEIDELIEKAKVIEKQLKQDRKE